MSMSTADAEAAMTRRAMRIDTLKTSIERNEYAVDPRAVAEAIVALLLRPQTGCS